MLKEKYKEQIKEIILKHLNKDVKVFIFGSSLEKERFNDVDVAVMGEEIEEKDLSLIRDELEDSLIPYKVDIIDFQKADEKFKNKVLEGKVLWLT